jgi:hypothetical protein
MAGATGRFDGREQQRRVELRPAACLRTADDPLEFFSRQTGVGAVAGHWCGKPLESQRRR